MWQHAIRESEVFHGHLNFFLVFESLLVAVFVSLLTDDHAPKYLALPLAIVGLISSLIWIYVQYRSKLILDCLTDMLTAYDDYFKLFLGRLGKPRILRFRNRQILAWLPLLFLLIWGGGCRLAFVS